MIEQYDENLLSIKPTPAEIITKLSGEKDYDIKHYVADIIQFLSCGEVVNILRNRIIAKNIRECRAKQGISQDKLSKLAGIALHTITKIQSRATPDPRIETVKKIADALGVSIDHLMR
ncbi:MAG: helix-turn-helix domain-containing protein [bacterium JZ-2024 1]